MRCGVMPNVAVRQMSTSTARPPRHSSTPKAVKCDELPVQPDDISLMHQDAYHIRVVWAPCRCSSATSRSHHQALRTLSSWRSPGSIATTPRPTARVCSSRYQQRAPGSLELKSLLCSSCYAQWRLKYGSSLVTSSISLASKVYAD